MTRDVLFHGVDLQELTQAVAAVVVAQLTPLLQASHEPRLVDRVRMAELLGISLPSLDRMVSSDEIPSVTIGTRRLFNPASVISSLEKETVC